jgi:ATP-dependent Lon protease
MTESETASQVLPVLPLRNTVLFPLMFAPLSVTRPASVAAIEAALASEEKTLVITAQRVGDAEPSTREDFFDMATRAVIKKMARTEGRLDLLVQGVERVRFDSFEEFQPYIKARVSPAPVPDDRSPEVEALSREVLELAGRMLALANPEAKIDLSKISAQAPDPARLVYLLGSMLSLDVAREQELLEARTTVEALKLLHGFMTHEIQVLELRQKIVTEAQSGISKDQREYLLRQQLRAIQQELGEQSPEKAEVDVLRERLSQADLPEEVRKEAEREIGRLGSMPAAAPDFQITRTHLELILELPFNKSTEDNLDLNRARAILDEDHYDLEEIKERILEHLAVLKLNPEAKAPILCFVGPPGVGKTSLGHSIARSLGRHFERMSLGGLHDESELRGHRRTYIGAMPGRLIQAIRRAGTNNPLLMLDEIDKLGHDFRGDPAAALLEVLDPAQNFSFRDNYLDLPFDLSRVFFITTANTLDTIPRPLLDRMEILRLAGYTTEEKMHISRRYLLPRQLRETGLPPDRVTIPDDTLERVITRYTREAGVRQLERTLGRIARKVALQVARDSTETIVVKVGDLDEMLGPERFFIEQARQKLPPGVAAGLAWTEAGGEVLYVEATLLPHGDGLKLTGQLGEIMRESVHAAQSYIWSHAAELGIDPELFRSAGVHVHVPSGAVPKDGPSAGVAMLTALTSLYTGKPARSDTAMTGEITLTGLVLPIGGVKEKVLAARRAGLKRIVLPLANKSDLRDVPKEAQGELEFLFVENAGEVLAETVPAAGSPIEAISRL